jgi:hypothetical protein
MVDDLPYDLVGRHGCGLLAGAGNKSLWCFCWIVEKSSGCRNLGAVSDSSRPEITCPNPPQPPTRAPGALLQSNRAACGLCFAVSGFCRHVLEDFFSRTVTVRSPQLGFGLNWDGMRFSVKLLLRATRSLDDSVLNNIIV